MLAGELGGRIGFPGEQRAQAGVHPGHVFAGQRVGEQAVRLAQQIVDVGLAGRRMGKIKTPVGVGGADQPVAVPRNDEEQAGGGPRDQPAAGVDPVARDDQVDPLGGPHPELSPTTQQLLDVVDPDSGRVDDVARADVELPPRLQVPDPGARGPVLVADEADDPGAAGHRCAVVGRGPTQHHGVPGVVDLTFVEQDRAADRLAVERGEHLEGLPAPEMAEVVRDATPRAHQVVDPDPQSGVGPVDRRPLHRVEERHRLGQVRRQFVQHQGTFLEGLEDQGRVELLQVTQTAVEELGGPTGRAGGEVPRLDQPRTQPAGDRIQGAAGTGHPGPDDQDVEFLARPTGPGPPTRCVPGSACRDQHGGISISPPSSGCVRRPCASRPVRRLAARRRGGCPTSVLFPVAGELGG